MTNQQADRLQRGDPIFIAHVHLPCDPDDDPIAWTIVSSYVVNVPAAGNPDEDREVYACPRLPVDRWATFAFTADQVFHKKPEALGWINDQLIRVRSSIERLVEQCGKQRLRAMDEEAGR